MDNDIKKQTEETKKYLDFFKDVEYFNFEFSRPTSKSRFDEAYPKILVINASRKGIDTICKRWITFKGSSGFFPFNDLVRPERLWSSWHIQDTYDHNKPYYITTGQGCRNSLVKELYVQYLPTHHDELVFCIGIKNNIAVLTINEKGWQQFLDMLLALKEDAYWFYVTHHRLALEINAFQFPLTEREDVTNSVILAKITASSNEKSKHSQKMANFQVTNRYNEDASYYALFAIECIRLEPDDHIFLHCSMRPEDIENLEENGIREPPYLNFSLDIHGNAGGFLLLSHWLKEFLLSDKASIKLFNYWTTYESDSSIIALPPSYLHLIKIESDSPYPLFSFEGKNNGKPDVYICGNQKGFEELSMLMEESAFNSNVDDFHCKPPNERLRGQPIEYGLGGFYPFRGYDLQGGGYFNPRYCTRRISN